MAPLTGGTPVKGIDFRAGTGPKARSTGTGPEPLRPSVSPGGIATVLLVVDSAISKG
jgi:hypothetical protein